jgi:hypothetical protein
MFIKVANPRSGRRTKMEARIIGKVLHLATFHGWRPERISWSAPSASWDTQVVMPYVSPYLSGVVSDSDARGLVVALKKVLASEGAGLQSDVYLGVLGLIAIAESGGFDLDPELEPENQIKVPSPAAVLNAGPSAPPPPANQ